MRLLKLDEIPWFYNQYNYRDIRIMGKRTEYVLRYNFKISTFVYCMLVFAIYALVLYVLNKTTTNQDKLQKIKDLQKSIVSKLVIILGVVVVFLPKIPAIFNTSRLLQKYKWTIAIGLFLKVLIIFAFIGILISTLTVLKNDNKDDSLKRNLTISLITFTLVILGMIFSVKIPHILGDLIKNIIIALLITVGISAPLLLSDEKLNEQMGYVINGVAIFIAFLAIKIGINYLIYR